MRCRPARCRRRRPSGWGAGRHLVTYRVRGGALVNLVAVLERPDWAEEGWSLPGDPDELRAAFAGWAQPVPTLLEAVSECFLWGLFDRPEQVRWVRDRLALIGDAAHPMLPFLAQGAAMAIEDGAALVRHLARRRASPPPSLPGRRNAGRASSACWSAARRRPDVPSSGRGGSQPDTWRDGSFWPDDAAARDLAARLALRARCGRGPVTG